MVAVGVPHEILYEEICVCVIPTPNVSLTVEDIHTFCQERFGEVGEGLMPDHILLFDSFPTGSTDKIDRKKIMEVASGRLGR